MADQLEPAFAGSRTELEPGFYSIALLLPPEAGSDPARITASGSLGRFELTETARIADAGEIAVDTPADDAE